MLSLIIIWNFYQTHRTGVIVKVMKYGIEVSDFKPQTRYYVNFQTVALAMS